MSLIGHGEALAAFTEAMRSGRLHHAWLLAGPQGVGKASFARAAALRLLAEAAGPPVNAPGLAVAEDHPIARLFDAGSHPDYRRLARLPKDRSDDLARSITVDQVRGLQPLFATTPSLSPRRIVLIDAIDDMERSAANALLKNLEEPPAGTIFLLVSHAPGRLLPTIRSRCRLLRFALLSRDETALVLARALPDSDAAEIVDLADIAGGAPGDAIRFAGLEIAAIDASIEKLVTHGDPSNALRSALARTLSGKAAQPRYEAFLERAPARIAGAARAARPDQLAQAIALWRQARDIADRAVQQSADPQTTVFEVAGLLAKLAPGPDAAKA